MNIQRSLTSWKYRCPHLLLCVYRDENLSQNVGIINCSSCHPLLLSCSLLRHQLQVSYFEEAKCEYVVDRRYWPPHTPGHDRDVSMSLLSVPRTKCLLSKVLRRWRSLQLFIYIQKNTVSKSQLLVSNQMVIWHCFWYTYNQMVFVCVYINIPPGKQTQLLNMAIHS